MNMLLARIVMIAKQIISDFISKNPARNSVAMVASSLLWSRPEHVSTPSMSRAPAQDQRIIPREDEPR
jgi:hypothetical protein